MIRLININKFYHSASEKFHALKDINLTFGQQGMHFIVGKSGSLRQIHTVKYYWGNRPI